MNDSIYENDTEYSFECWYWNGDYTIKTATYSSEEGHRIYKEFKA